MSSHTAATGDAFLGLLGLAAALFGIYLLVGWVRRNLGRLGLTTGEVALIVWATLLGAAINIPLVPFGEGWLAINVGGGVVPILLSLYLVQKKSLPINEVLVGIVVVGAVSHLVSDYRPGVGVVSVFPLWLLPAFTAFLVGTFAWWHERPDAAALAYVSGALGALIGADIVRLPLILSGPPPAEGAVLSIGGGAIFDMVYLTGLLAVAMHTSQLARERFRLGSPGRGNPIDAEFDAWVRNIEAWEKEKAERRRGSEAHRRAASKGATDKGEGRMARRTASETRSETREAPLRARHPRTPGGR